MIPIQKFPSKCAHVWISMMTTNWKIFVAKYVALVYWSLLGKGHSISVAPPSQANQCGDPFPAQQEEGSGEE